MFDPRHLKSAKLLLSSLFIFSAIIFVIHAYSINYHDFLHSATNKEPSENLQAQSHRFKEQIRSTLSNLPLHSIQEENVRIQAGNQNDLVAPLGVTELERIAWFRKNLHKFDILKSNNSTRRFHSRVLEFFSRECEAQFFMTWISPAGSFGVRELMSVESVFKVHPGACLVILSRTLETTDGYTVLKPLLDSRFKVQVVTPDLPILFKGTPAEAWFRELIKGKKDPGEIPLSQNLSNLIRLVVLYKYGGIYIDTDFIVLKPLTGLRNSIGAQSMDLRSKHWTRLNNAVLIFDMKHPLLHEFISEFALTFDGNKWGHNGPYLVSRVIKRLLKRPSFIFKILPPMAFYPADWNKIRGFLRKPKTQTESKWVEAKVLQLCAETYGIHLWNKQSRRLTIEDGSVIGKLALNHCVICNHIFSS
ncbi:hypothetical protein HN51_048249 [Arachis hypogaea]|uniref:Alpha 1,4-glycosyltransferase domain-containing protein n=1 Tax=Arachis hypogaea TaxID=3818 RepID=A0A445AK95_ARAHY|nr:lactosylceramide 4-alpha-galactosyltransferase-like [Arachis ipaensis]XP_025633710.1 lactosylceramide 4-alpha-galactosyltransferase-like [Arachis hypogaea]QHO24730.1 uncharacterized protein DS421_12g374780 [Arachis hypogaea]RYR26843.1 hypothetical protein Ahy_B02g061159 isoform E [Arachis hypogaea]